MTSKSNEIRYGLEDRLLANGDAGNTLMDREIDAVSLMAWLCDYEQHGEAFDPNQAKAIWEGDLPASVLDPSKTEDTVLDSIRRELYLLSA